MRFKEALSRNLRALPLATRLIAVPVAAILTAAALSAAIWQLLMAPFWGVLLGIAVGGYLYVWTDLRLAGYRQVIMILLVSEILGRPLPFEELSTIAFILTYLAMFAIFEPGQFRRHRRQRRAIAST